jgi:hypothetical protein
MSGFATVNGCKKRPGSRVPGPSRSEPRSALEDRGESAVRPRGAEGVALDSRGVGPLLPGPGRAAERDAVTSRRTATSVRYRERTSLRLPSRMRATTFVHVVFLLRSCRRPRAQRSEPPPHTDVRVGGVGRHRSVIEARRPRGHAVLAEAILRRTIPGRIVPARRAIRSVTPKTRRNRVGACFRADELRSDVLMAMDHR